MLTVYTLGRCASSPAIHFDAVSEKALFATALHRGFDELWDAETTEVCSWPLP